MHSLSTFITTVPHRLPTNINITTAADTVDRGQSGIGIRRSVLGVCILKLETLYLMTDGTINVVVSTHSTNVIITLYRIKQ